MGLDELAIVTCHFNPLNYNLPLRNYWEWRHSLGSMQNNLFTVELSFDGEFSIKDSIKIKGNETNFMWQKEALINEGIRRLPDHFKYVAWIDHDLIFSSTTWPEEIIEQSLNGFEFIQLFSSITYEQRCGTLSEARQSYCANYCLGSDGRGVTAPGGAWASRISTFKRVGGLISNNIIGGGDSINADAWTNTSSHYFKSYSGPLAQDGIKRKEEIFRKIQGRVTFLYGNVKHLYHGDRSNRKYVERASILRKHEFHPEKDIRLNSDGIWEWCSDKPDLHRDVRQYFQDRQEDS